MAKFTRPIFFISDGTGITAETLGRSLLTQFEQFEFNYTTVPYVDTPAKAREIVSKINIAYKETQERPIVFATIVDTAVSEVLKTANCLFIDFFHTFLNPLTVELGYKPKITVGKFHSIRNYTTYISRIDAVNYALASDDGINTKDYRMADIILIGVSRSGKTPTSLYLALQFGIFAANYPLTEENFSSLQLPQVLQSHKNKLFGLVIDPQRLQQIRQTRLPDTHYASLEQCRLEIKQLKELLQREDIPFSDTTHRSIEELAAEIVAKTNLKKRI